MRWQEIPRSDYEIIQEVKHVHRGRGGARDGHSSCRAFRDIIVIVAKSDYCIPQIFLVTKEKVNKDN